MISTNGNTATRSSVPSDYQIVNDTLVLSGSSLLAIPRVKERPRPTKTLNIGPATQPVIAISPKPFLVMATSAAKSPRQLPQEMTVRASRASGRVVMNPKI